LSVRVRLRTRRAIQEVRMFKTKIFCPETLRCTPARLLSALQKGPL